MTRASRVVRIMASVAAGALTAASAGGALAQTADASAQGSVLGEVVVTATKQTSTVNKVPLSITAVTQKSLDQQGVERFSDIVRTVPALALQTPSVGDRIPQISIRGVASTIGAQTTGIYLDDTPLQKRNAIGISGSGTPIPELFDLDRVEVLRGPQGTLYGGSSEGGTIRYITPAPSLTRYSAYAKAEAATTENGAPSYSGGVAVGGPIVQDKVGFRASVWSRHTGGYIDHVDIYSGRTLAKDTNSDDASSARLAVLVKPTEQLSITPSIYVSQDKANDTDVFWLNIPQVTVGATAVHPATTYGPYNVFGVYKSGTNCNVGLNYVGVVPTCPSTQPRLSRLMVPTMSLQYDFGAVTAKSITSYVQDETKGIIDYSFQEPINAQGGFPLVANLPLYSSHPHFKNKRDGITEEFRLSSNNPGDRLTWVAGAYYGEFHNTSKYYIVANFDQLQKAQSGATVVLEPGNVTYHRDQLLKENELAGFGELNFSLTSKLKLIAGVRYSHTEFQYNQVTAGALAGFLTPTVANGGLTNGKQTGNPVTPKFGVQYQLTDNDMLYVTAAQGYRVGGVNQPPPVPRCANDLANLGITSSPPTYASDSLWSYEAGAKVKAFDNRAQMNASAFYIDWSNVQTAFSLPTCGFGYTINAGKAISEGFDFQGEVKITTGLTGRLQVAYTDAKYTKEVRGPAPSNTLFIRDGDKLPVAPWTLNVGAQYDFELMGRYSAYVRGDYQYASEYQRSFGPGTSTYAADSWQASATHFATARAGVAYKGVDASIFVDNLFNSQDVLGKAGARTGCSVATGAACTTYAQYVYPIVETTFRPRTVGLTLTYRY